MPNLQILHDELYAALAEMKVLTSRPEFDRAELSRIRYRLSRVSGERRRLVELLCAMLAERATGFQAERIAALRESTRKARLVSSAHVSSWSLRAIAEDWNGYRDASAKMRTAMRAQIAAEKAALEPFLAQSGVAQAAGMPESSAA